MVYLFVSACVVLLQRTAFSEPYGNIRRVVVGAECLVRDGAGGSRGGKLDQFFPNEFR